MDPWCYCSVIYLTTLKQMTSLFYKVILTNYAFLIISFHFQFNLILLILMISQLQTILYILNIIASLNTTQLIIGSLYTVFLFLVGGILRSSHSKQLTNYYNYYYCYYIIAMVKYNYMLTNVISLNIHGLSPIMTCTKST